MFFHRSSTPFEKMLKGNERASSPFACRLNGMATRRCSLVSFIPAILLHRDIIFDASRFVVVESCARIGDQFVKGIERTRGRVYFNYFARFIFNIPRMGVVNWIHLFPFFKIRLRSWYYRLFGYFSRLRFRPAPPPLCPSSCVIILRNFNPPVRYRVRSLLGSIPTSSIRKSHEISNEVTILPTSVPTVPTVSSRETI